MAKRLNYEVAFTPNTTALKSALAELQANLSKIASINIGVESKGLKEAKTAATELQKYLNFSTDSFGNLNLTKFSTQLKKAGTSVSDISKKLISIGPEGREAFSSLTRSIAEAQVPLKHTNELLKEFGTTLKNTLRWQISSSILHSMAGALSDAVNYAHRLDSSLNDIRIVSGQSTEQMKKFAVEANKAAKALSTTTVDYTDAALIFYQAGLSGDEVTKRTDTTIKMANVTGDTVEEVSSYMTAIWNNFDDGSESLEHYADVITALGASTASSSAEIAEGLEKFASVGETIGLSYDYATSALATIVATTRQSADTVGTALKTIFSRLQGLSLGESLEDGVDLNKYSKALEKVGVQVLDNNGKLRDADDILSDLAAKWKILGRAEQTALAQTVAGVRQYTQLEALMNNWDFMETNLNTAKNAAGTLEKQAKIYEESWSAANKRVKASFEGIFNKLEIEDFAVSFLDATSSIIDSFGAVVDGLGGFKTLLIGIAAIATTKFAPQITAAFGTLRNNIHIALKGEEDLRKVQMETLSFLASSKLKDNNIIGTNAEIDAYTELIQMKQIAKDKTGELTAQENALNELILENTQKNIDKLRELSETAEVVSAELQTMNEELFVNSVGRRTNPDNFVLTLDEQDDFSTGDYSEKTKQLFSNFGNDGYTNAGLIVEEYTKAQQMLVQYGTAYSVLEKQSRQATQFATNDIENLKKETRNGLELIQRLFPETYSIAEQTSTEAFNRIKEGSNTSKNAIVNDLKTITDTFNALRKSEVTYKNEMQSFLRDRNVNINELSGKSREVEKTRYQQRLQEEKLRGGKNKIITETVSPSALKASLELAGALGQVYMAWSSIASLPRILTDDDISGMEKFMSVLMSISIGFPAVISGIKSFKSAFAGFDKIGKNISKITEGIKEFSTNLQNQKDKINEIKILQEALNSSAPYENSGGMTTNAIQDRIETLQEEVKQYNDVEAAINKLNSAQKNELTVTELLSLATIEETKEEAINTLVTEGHTVAAVAGAIAVGNYALAFDILGASIKNATKAALTFLATPIGQVLAIVSLAIGAIVAVKAYNEYISTSAEEANEKIKEVSESLNGATDELQKLESELDNVKQKILEIKSLDSISLTDAEELSRLQAEEKSLENLIKLRKEEIEASQKDLIKTEEQLAISESGLKKSNYEISLEDNAKDNENYENIKYKKNSEKFKINTEDGIAVTAFTAVGDDGGIGRETYFTREEWENILQELNNKEEDLTKAQREVRDAIQKGLDEADGGLNMDKYIEDLEIMQERLDAYREANLEKTSQFYKDIESLSKQTKRVRGEESYNAMLDGFITPEVSSEINSQYREIQAMIGEGLDEEEIINRMNEIGFEGAEALSEGLWRSGGSIQDFFDRYLDEVENTQQIINEGIDNMNLDDRVAAALQDRISIHPEFAIDIFNNIGDTDALKNILGISDEDAKNLGYNTAEDFIKGLQDGILGSQLQNTLDSLDIETSLRNRLVQAYNSLSTEEEKEYFIKYIPTLDEQELENLLSDTQRQIEEGLENDRVIKIKAQIETDIDDSNYNFTYDDVDELAEHYMKTAKSSDILGDSLADNKSEALKAAFTVNQLNNGIEDLAENFEFCSKEIKKGSGATSDYVKSMSSLKKSVKDVTGIADELAGLDLELSDEFIINNIDDIEKAADGDIDAINRLKAASAEDILLQVVGVDNFDELAPKIQEKYSGLQAILDQQDLTIGATIDNQEALAAMEDIINAAEMTEDEATAFLAGMGVDAEVVPAETPMGGSEWTIDWKTINIPKLEAGYFSIGGQTISLPFPKVVPSATSTQQIGAGLKITSAKGNKTSGGHVTQKNTGGYSKNKSGGGGGGGGGSAYESDKLEKDNDPFEYLKRHIDDLADAYDDLSKVRDRTFDADKVSQYTDDMVANIDEQISAMEQLMDANAKLVGIGIYEGDEGYEDTLKGKAAKIAQSVGLNLEIDPNGSIKNIYNIREALLQAVQSQLDAMDGSTDENASDKASEIKDKLEEDLKVIDDFIEGIDLRNQYANEIAQKQLDRIDTQLDGIAREVEIKITIDDAALSEIERRLSHLSHYDYNAVSDLTAQEKKLDILQDKIAVYTNQVAKLKALMEANPDDANIIEQYYDALDKLNSAMSDAEDMVDTIGESIEKTFSKITDAASHATSIFNSYTSTLESMQKTLALAGKKYTESSTYLSLAKAINKVNNDNLKTLKDEYATMEEYVAALEASYNQLQSEGVDDAVLKQYRDQLKSQKEELASLGSELQSALENALSAIVEQATAAFEMAITQAEKKLLGTTVDLAQKFYDEYADLADNYLDDTEKAYELDKIAREITTSMQDSKNLTKQKELAKLLEETQGYQENGVKLSQHDVDLLQAKYDLTLAQIALEEAQNAKTSMRLTRDASGNYSYVYTADTSAISKAEQDVADKQQNIYKMQKEYANEISSMLYDALNQYTQLQKDLLEQYHEGILTEEEFNAKREEAAQIYQDKIAYIYGELNKVYENSDLTYANSVLSMTSQTAELEELFRGAGDFIEEVSTSAKTTVETETGEINTALESVGTTADKLADDFDSSKEKIVDSAEDLKDRTANELAQFRSEMDDTIAKAEEMARRVSEAFAKIAAAEAQKNATSLGYDENKDYTHEIASIIVANKDADISTEMQERQNKIDALGVTNVESNAEIQDLIDKWVKKHDSSAFRTLELISQGMTFKAAKATAMSEFDTGGYTGDWDSTGRLAVLHQKELVLNKTDTENILSAVQSVRAMSSAITSDIATNVLSLLSSLGSISGGGINVGSKDLVPQQVSIDATFPGVTEAVEIKDALNGLLTQAAQFASIKEL